MTIELMRVMNWRPLGGTVLVLIKQHDIGLFHPRIIAREDTLLTGALGGAGYRTSGHGLRETVPILPRSPPLTTF